MVRGGEWQREDIVLVREWPAGGPGWCVVSGAIHIFYLCLSPSLPLSFSLPLSLPLSLSLPPSLFFPSFVLFEQPCHATLTSQPARVIISSPLYTT